MKKIKKNYKSNSFNKLRELKEIAEIILYLACAGFCCSLIGYFIGSIIVLLLECGG